MIDITSDWSKFGHIEIEEAKELLSHIKEIETYGKVEVQFNLSSGFVFLVDEDFNVFMMNNDKIEQFYSCSECGEEGFKEEFTEENRNSKIECSQCLEIGSVEE